jgi:hypothetical protein
MEKKIISVRFSFSQKLKIFFSRQILGIKDNDEISVDDPCSDEFYEYFRRTAKTNAKIYEDVFNTLPTNRIRCFNDVESYTQRPKFKYTNPLAV